MEVWQAKAYLDLSVWQEIDPLLDFTRVNLVFISFFDNFLKYFGLLLSFPTSPTLEDRSQNE